MYIVEEEKSPKYERVIGKIMEIHNERRTSQREILSL